MRSLSVHEEIQELRSALKVKDLADVVGCRRETLSRLKPPRRPSREVERRLDDTFTVVAQARRTELARPGQMRHFLLSRRTELANRSIAEMIRDNLTRDVLALLDSVTAPTLDEDLDELLAEFDELEPAASSSCSGDHPPGAPALAPDLQEALDAVVRNARPYFGDLTVSFESVFDDTGDADEAAILLVELHSELPFAQADTSFRTFLKEHLALIQAVADRMTVTVSGTL